MLLPSHLSNTCIHSSYLNQTCSLLIQMSCRLVSSNKTNFWFAIQVLKMYSLVYLWSNTFSPYSIRHWCCQGVSNTTGTPFGRLWRPSSGTVWHLWDGCMQRGLKYLCNVNIYIPSLQHIISLTGLKLSLVLKFWFFLTHLSTKVLLLTFA